MFVNDKLGWTAKMLRDSGSIWNILGESRFTVIVKHCWSQTKLTNEYKITHHKIITARSLFSFLHFHFNCGLSIFSFYSS